MNKKNKGLQKFFTVVTSITFLANSFITPFSIIAQEVSPTPAPTPIVEEVQSPTPEPTVSPVESPTPTPEMTPTPSEVVTPTVEPTPTPTVVQPTQEPQPTQAQQDQKPAEVTNTPVPTPTVEPTVTPTETVVTEPEKLCFNNQSVYRETSYTDWSFDGQVYETKENVELGVRYVFPSENKVTVTFNCLPKDESLRTTLKIQQVKVSDLKLPSDVKTDSEYAYDINTGMTDGTFEYDVTLPKPENSTAEVSYIEKTVNELKTTQATVDDVKKIEESQIGQEGDQVKASGIDHFTVFLIKTYSSSSFNVEKEQYKQGEVVYTKAEGLKNNKYYKINIIKPDNSSENIKDCTTGVSELSDSYSLSSNATISTNWKAEIKEYDKCTGWGCGWFGESSYCRNETNPTDSKSDNFEVISSFSIVQPTLTYNANDDYALTSVSGIWTAVTEGSNINGLNTQEVRWGYSTGYGQSGLRFDGSGLQSFNEGNNFYLGALTHFNWPITNAATGAKLKITLQFSKPSVSPNPDFTYDFVIDETSNNWPCNSGWQQSSTPCDDKVTFPNSYGEKSFQIGDKLYTLRILGFVNSYPSGTPVTQFVTEEQKNNTAYLVGTLSSVLVAAPQISLVQKSVNGDDADTAPGQNIYIGDATNFTYSVQNTGNVTMTGIVLHDDKGLTVACPKTTLISGESMTCTASSTAVAGQYTNTAHVHGTYNSTQYTSNNESANYYGVQRPADVKVILCHSTSSPTNPYNEIEVNINSTSKCLDANGHGLDPNDIIPSYTYDTCTYPGLNLDTVIQGSTGQQILDNHCVIPPQTGTLTVIKHVDNTGGGTKVAGDFSITVTGNSPSPATFSGVESPGSTVTLGTGTYSVDEATVGHYDKNLSAGCSGTMTGGGSATCTITNTYHPYCGDNNVNQPSEECDGSPTQTCETTTGYSGTKTCDNASCLWNNCESSQFCGDGIKNENEVCDEGYGVNGTYGHCNLTCTGPGERCGDGVKNGDEECDDGNSVNTDTCLNTCVSAKCGDGIVESGVEECDDNNSVNNDACTNSCTLPTCGDGIINQESEQCDDGNSVNTDACLNTCQLPVCGDGYIQSGVEECDDGAGNLFDCTAPYGGSCSYCHGATCENVTVQGPYCGDNIKNGSEECDGTDLGGLPSTDFKCNKCKVELVQDKVTICHANDSQKKPYVSETPNKSGDVSGHDGHIGPIWYPGIADHSWGDIIPSFDYWDNGLKTYVGKNWTSEGQLIWNNGCSPIPGTVIVKKITDPATDILTDFTFTGSPSGTIKNNETITVSGLLPGTYTTTESTSGLTGWDLTDITCDDKNSTGDIKTATATFNLESNETVTCTFTNTKQASISGTKWNDLNANGVWDKDTESAVTHSDIPGGVTIYLDLNNNGQYDSGEPTTTTDNDGNYVFNNVATGRYGVCERNDLLSGWKQTYPLNEGCQGIFVNTGDDLTDINFGNYQEGKVTVYKFNDLNGNGTHDTDEPYLSDWEINITPTDSGEISGITSGSGSAQFNLKPASYTLSETIKDGWYQSGITCSGGDESNVKITAPGEAYGHHGWCSGWNDCGDAATCALWACEVNNYSNLVSYGAQKPCTQFNNCNLFHNRGNVQMNWGNWCEVMGVTDIVCSNSGLVNNNNYKLTVEPGADKTCYVGNYQKATLTVTKDVLDPLGQPIDDNKSFTTAVTGQSDKSFSELSPASYSLSPGTYTVSEVNITPGYSLKSNNDLTVTLTSGQSQSVNFTNWQIQPKLAISKSNDASSDKTPGGSVTYTIKVTATDSAILSAKVKDLLPSGFVYRAGSWKAISSIRGDISSLGEPQYHSPGTWTLGDMEDGEVVTLTYIADISSDQQPGLYKDLAWTAGTSLSNNQVLGSAETTGYVDDNFVGTQVNVAKEQQESTSLKVEKEETGEVLGASTGLPATGATTLWSVIAAIILGLGSLLVALGLVMKKKSFNKILGGLFILGLFISLMTHKAYAASTSIRLEQPKSPSNQNSFNLTFVSLDLNDSPITIKCYKKGPSDANFNQFGANIDLANGGNTGTCAVDSSVVNDKGTYQFYVNAKGSESVDSPIVTVDYNKTDGPGTPSGYSKERVTSCEYKIKFTTANDSNKTIKVEIYRSDKTEFNLDGGSKVGTLNIGSNQSATFNDVVSDCNKEYYYAVRAFDSYGNGSGVVGDSVITITTTTVSSPTTGAIPVEGVTLPAEISPATEKAEVLGLATPSAEVQTYGKSGLQKVLAAATSRKNLPITIGVGILLIGIIAYVIFRKKAPKIEQ